ncbi:unnamed protein product, partial [Soboliphyme baturini]|uniref:PPIase cyclophilin-type domain-containing protein n=1 Tax=Soboliphyme baturini TaxID=241478 RepID=A0A183J6W5_9BILA
MNTACHFRYILPYLRKYGKNPVTGEPLHSNSLIKLNFYKNKEGDYHCPVTYRVFTNNSHVIAIRTTGNVYSYDAVEELNLKTKHMKDLLTDDPFVKSDIITLQDPYNLEKFNISTFDHVKKKLFKLKSEEDEEPKGSETSSSRVVRSMNTETKETLLQLEKDYQAPEKKVEIKPKADRINAASYSTGMVAAGFTSTVMEPLTEHEAAIIDEDSLVYAHVKKKGYVRLVTNFGPLNLELFCNMVPRACENFIVHCKEGYYRNTHFHRLIRNFVVRIQGGDPTGTGKGGESIWQKPFVDEFRQELSHNTRGVLSMANSGPNTNTSQFFLTFRSCKQLDRKHTIFGKLVGGFETLNLIE